MPRPTASELISFIVELEDDPSRRSALGTGWTLFEAAREAELVGQQEIDALATVIGGLIESGLLVYGSQAAGRPPVPDERLWSSAVLQEHFDYSSTDRGRADAERYRARMAERPTPTSILQQATESRRLQ